MNKINLIFDCDGTIMDSYESIVDRVYKVFSHFNVYIDKIYVKELALFNNVAYAVQTICKENNLDFDTVSNYFDLVKPNIDLITIYPNLDKVLDNSNFQCFVYTHRGISCKEVLNKFNLLDKFIEVVDSTYNLKRKPNPDGIDYLVDKYGLDKSNTYYVGDRLIDIECGINAKVKTIFFKSSNLPIDSSNATFIINDLDDINNIKF